jgi:hypothetical protein
VRKPKPETAAERVDRMQRQIAALRSRRESTTDPLERGRLSLSIHEREAGLVIFQRTQRAIA